MYNTWSILKIGYLELELREVIEFADGGASALDWLHPLNEAAAADPKTPLVLFFPGITGESSSDADKLIASWFKSKSFRIIPDMVEKLLELGNLKEN